MSKKQPAPFPTKEEILDFVRRSPDRVGKREIARAFDIRGDDRVRLKKLLREMKDDGLLDQGRGQRLREGGTLPPVGVVVVDEIDADGEVVARPEKWDADEHGPPPRIYMAPVKRGLQPLAVGDRALANLKQLDDGTFEGRTIRVIAKAPPRVLGIYYETDGEGRVQPTDKRHRSDLSVHPEDTKGAMPGDLVRVEVQSGRRLGLKKAKVLECLHRPDEDARQATVIAIHDHDIVTEFSDEAVQEAERLGAAPMGKREDLRKVPLVTIDGADAKDFDDAVWAEPDDQAKNPGGWHIIVAIADVSWYVRPGMALDEDAYQRGNSTYFPDRAVPMLPEALSTGWCSLNPDVERPVIAAHLWIDKDGNLLRHRFVRGMMHSAARLTYAQVQTAHDGQPDETTAPLVEAVIAPLYGAYQSLAHNRHKRGVLEIEMPERRILLDEEGRVQGVEPRARYDSHRLIEEFMILANVAAAETLEQRHQPCMYRVHDSPSLDKLELLRQFLDSLEINLPKGQVFKSEHFNRILERVKDTEYQHMVNEVVLRTQSQAEYSPKNIGHFGLALKRYCHFTSPIRRYSDLLVHRALVRGLGLGEGGLPEDHGDFDEMGTHLSGTERKSAAAERDAVARYVAAYLEDKVGATFAGRVTGVTRFGLFVTLDAIGGDGLIPIKTLPDDYYIHDEARHMLVGRATNLTFRLGEELGVVLEEADPVTGGMILSLAEADQPRPWENWTSDRGRGGKPKVSSRGRNKDKAAKARAGQAGKGGKGTKSKKGAKGRAKKPRGRKGT